MSTRRSPIRRTDSSPYQPLTNSVAIRAVNDLVDRAAASDVTVLIWGESGVGKELVARTLHERSNRSKRPFVKVNCAALPVDLLESELFGYERGAFTGANVSKPGKFELADTGTIFLDEIGEMPLPVQAKLLQVLQDHEFSRLGSRQDIRVDVRVIAATNRDLPRHVAQGGFREDLFYRLNVVDIRVPPLRERPEEIPILVEHFLAVYGRAHRRHSPAISPPTLERFLRYSWPGNVRELENMVKRIVVLGSESAVARLTEVDRRLASGNGEHARLSDRDDDLASESLGLKEVARRAVEVAERRMLTRTLEMVHWRRVEAAQRLRISYKTLLEKIKRYELDRHTGAPGGRRERPAGGRA